MLILYYLFVIFAVEIVPNNTLNIKIMICNWFASDFDFSKKRVRFQGRSLTKFELSYFISRLDPWSCYGLYPDLYPYSDYKAQLEELVYTKLS